MKATYQDVLDAPEHKVAEILDGRLYLSPRPAPVHAHSKSVLSAILGNAFWPDRGASGRWWLLNEPELHFGEQVVVPDIAGWRVERLPRMPRVDFFTLPPDWICEILSPVTERIDRALKLRIYGEADVARAWYLDPLQRTLEMYRRSEARWVLVDAITGTAPVRLEPFEAVELELGALWPDVEEPATSG